MKTEKSASSKTTTVKVELKLQDRSGAGSSSAIAVTVDQKAHECGRLFKLPVFQVRSSQHITSKHSVSLRAVYLVCSPCRDTLQPPATPSSLLMYLSRFQFIIQRGVL
jgi:hypothetical protein